MQLFCPRCEGDLVKATYYSHFCDVTLKRAHTWYAKSIYVIIYFLQGEYSAWGPGMLKCTHCGYYTENIPSSFFKPGSVMVPRAVLKPKKVKTSTALIIVFFLLAVCIELVFLNIQAK